MPTSRVTRVTRSPVLALSTAPSGSRRIVRTMYSRAVESRSWPKQRRGALGDEGEGRLQQHHPDDHQGELVSSGRPPPSTVVLTSSPSSRGTTSPVAGGERVEHDERGEHAASAAQQVAEEGRARRGCPTPASRARGCGRRRRRPRRAGGAGRGAAHSAALRSRGRRVDGRDQLRRDDRRVEGAVAPGVGGGGEEVGHRDGPLVDVVERPGHDAAVGRVVREQVGVLAVGDDQRRPGGARRGRRGAATAATPCTTTVVRPRRSSVTRSAMRASVWASTAEVGSTSTRIGASTASARASTTRWRWPPDRPRPRSSSWPCQPSGSAS